MFGLFKKTPVAPPSFDALAAYPHKDCYFHRTAQWYWVTNKEITIIDPHQPRMVTLDQLPQMVFLSAGGSKTVEEFIRFTVSKYRRGAPPQLDATIIAELDSLIREKLIALSDAPQSPHADHDMPLKLTLQY
ncbi:hypothetical protein [Chitinophaga vietnamensis]|uniref:hypothetical protein n=1 Tax=Chitinophaga vietnamensis TaxID=2593957 RepID=UPI001177F21B|nr:hypothetical protein [Chitinophaga vietnamensis]